MHRGVSQTDTDSQLNMRSRIEHREQDYDRFVNGLDTYQNENKNDSVQTTSSEAYFESKQQKSDSDKMPQTSSEDHDPMLLNLDDDQLSFILNSMYSNFYFIFILDL